MALAIQINDFSCGYGTKFRIEDIHLEVPEGCFTSIIGPNGAGKTTLFRGITGSLPANRGGVFIEGKNIATMSYKERAQRIAIVNQSVKAGNMTIEEYVLMGRLPYRTAFRFFETQEDYKISEESMRLTGVWDKKDKPMDRLSGGEQQLAAIARALAQKTKILLLDEPTAHLDISHQMKVLNLIQRLNRDNGLTVLLIIHDLNLASEYSDYLVMLSQGKVFAGGTPEEVLTYDHIEKVYDTVVVSRTNPVSGKPFIFPVSESALKTATKL
ncbi:MAG: ABC transporter ATP-binding protein [Odoribacter sp.]